MNSYYANPNLALVAGTQSTIDPKQAAGILKEVGVTREDGLKDAGRIHQWLGDHFKHTTAGGGFVGKTTARSLLESRELSGCHDWALMLATLLRSAGYPAMLVDTAGTQWMADVREGRSINAYYGHVFVEAYIHGRWVLLDSTSRRYIPNYDPTNRLIPMPVGNQNSYYVMFKGQDPAGYGLQSVGGLNDAMIRFAESTDLAGLRVPDYHILDLPSAGVLLPAFSDDDLARPTQLNASRLGVIRQFRKAGFDIHIEKADGRYLAHLYRYGRVFSDPIKTLSFSTLSELKGYLRTLEPAE